MIDASDTNRALPRPGLLRWEIGIALLIKIILLTGLWFLIFRWQDRPPTKPDMAARLAISSVHTQANPDFSSQPVKEPPHVR